MTTTKKSGAVHKKFGKPDETRKFELWRLDLLNIGGGAVGLLEFHPGWRWSTHIKPSAGTEWCEAPHFQYHISGTLRVRMADGTEFDAVPGDVTMLPSGHDAWVVGDEAVVAIDWQGASVWARPEG